MFHAVLTNLGEGGSPFERPETAPQAPGSPLRVSEDATLIAFVNQPDRLFAGKYALASGKVVWHVTEEMLHRDDLPADKIFSSCQEFQVWLSRRDKE